MSEAEAEAAMTARRGSNLNPGSRWLWFRLAAALVFCSGGWSN